MGRQAAVTKEDVFKVCDEMDAAKHSPSVRTVLAKLGGSTAIISEHLREWRKSKQNVPARTALSDSVMKAIADHTEKSINDATADLKKELESRDKDIDDLCETLKSLEDRLATTKDDNYILSRQSDSLETENKLLKNHIQGLEIKVSSLNEENLIAARKAAFAEGKLAGLEHTKEIKKAEDSPNKTNEKIPKK